MKQIIKIINIDFHNSRLDQAATFLYEDFSRSQIQRWVASGHLLVNGESLRPKDKVHEGDELSLDPVLENKVSWEGENIDLAVHHEEEHFLIINKPPGLVMHPGAGCSNGTLANALAFHYPELTKLPRCGIVHRLDKDTSGLLVIAKTEKFRNFFVDKLQSREVYKQYEALVVGQVIGSFSIDQAIEISNEIAPEHLNLCVTEPRYFLKRVKNAGLILLGKKSSIALSDYVLGPSHVLPTGGSSRFASSLCVEDFMKFSNIIDCEKIYNTDDYESLLNATELLAKKEGLVAHAISAKIRKNK